ncbi:hypothetical protein Tco_0764376 [Tanacetum coccineum]
MNVDFHSPLTEENDTRVDYLLFFPKNNLYDTLLIEQIPHQKKKVLGGELFTESSSKMNENENLFVPASMRHVSNESFKPTKNTLESSKDSKAESLTPLPPLKNLQGASPSSEDTIVSFISEEECNTCGSTVHSTTDHNEFDHFKRVSPISINHEKYTLVTIDEYSGADIAKITRKRLKPGKHEHGNRRAPKIQEIA